ncbi:SDR family NAD(P)-dependent oxidoreductase [Luteococcus sp. Sow4_B9]|uniref:SDR family NAD(P)-dependent oxidoreductase n=1 Tax=Luteococcus sp. Sow4_B9 TaxID=3438792 RepID=UPI003F9C88AE
MRFPRPRAASTFGPGHLSPNQLTGQVWLVTGATHGLGEATARAAARAGARLVVPARNAERARRLTSEWGGEHLVVPLDLASFSSVRECAAQVSRALAGQQIDVLVNNAGTMTLHRELTADGHERILQTNFLGPFALTNLLLPSVGGRVVLVASNAHKAGRIDHGDPDFLRRRWTSAAAYAQSKLAVMLWGLALEARLRTRGVDVQLVHPGWVMSNMQSAVGNVAVQRAIDIVTSPVAAPAADAARCTLFAATADLPRGSHIGPDGWLVGWRGEPCLIGRSGKASDPAEAERVWRLAAELTGTDR